LTRVVHNYCAEYEKVCSAIIFDREKTYLTLSSQLEADVSIAELYQRVKTHYPRAGRTYWAINVWRQIIWQPIYLCLVSVDKDLPLPNLVELRQCVQGSVVYKMAPVQEWQLENETSSLTSVAGKLNQAIDSTFSQLQNVCRLQRHRAEAQVQDILAIALQRICSDASLNALQNSLEQWHQALLMPSRNKFIKTNELERADCCMHLKIEPDSPCNNCPQIN